MMVVFPFQPHRTVLEKHGKPDDAIPAIKGVKEPLPSVPVSGMYNKSGGKVRLTFKLESDQLWIGTKGKRLMMSWVNRVVLRANYNCQRYHERTLPKCSNG